MSRCTCTCQLWNFHICLSIIFQAISIQNDEFTVNFMLIFCVLNISRTSIWSPLEPIYEGIWPIKPFQFFLLRTQYYVERCLTRVVRTGLTNSVTTSQGQTFILVHNCYHYKFSYMRVWWQWWQCVERYVKDFWHIHQVTRCSNSLFIQISTTIQIHIAMWIQ